MAKKIFISHGHKELVKHRVKDFVRDRLHMEPIVLSEQPDLGLTIVEKLERYAKDCYFALIILSADDQMATGDMRARQNVIHELGYFHGLLGRKKVLLLKESGVELFSNISGLIYKEFSGNNIQSVFGDIHLLIETGDASLYAMSVPTPPTPMISMSVPIFQHLCGVALLKRYKYAHMSSTQREWYFLRDNGFIKPRPPHNLRELEFNEQHDGENFAEIAEPTEIGWSTVKLRKKDIPSELLEDKENLNIDPSAL